MTTTFIINNTNLSHNALYKVLSENKYNPYVLKFNKLHLIENYLDEKCHTLFFFVITKISQHNRIIFQENSYDLNEMLSKLQNKNVNYYVFVDFNIRKTKNHFECINKNVKILMGTNEFKHNKSKMLYCIKKNILNGIDQKHLINHVFNDLIKCKCFNGIKCT